MPLYWVPKLYDGHGWVKDGDQLEPMWSGGPFLPPTLIDRQDTPEYDEETDYEEVTDYDDLLEYLDDNND